MCRSPPYICVGATKNNLPVQMPSLNWFLYLDRLPILNPSYTWDQGFCVSRTLCMSTFYKKYTAPYFKLYTSLQLLENGSQQYSGQSGLWVLPEKWSGLAAKLTNQNLTSVPNCFSNTNKSNQAAISLNRGIQGSGTPEKKTEAENTMEVGAPLQLV